MRKKKDFVITIVSHKDNVVMRQKLIKSIKEYVPLDFDYDVIVETGGNNWNEGMYLAMKQVIGEYDLKYGVFNFDDDIILRPDSFNNMGEYLERYEHFQFRMNNEGMERKVSRWLVKTPALAQIIRNKFFDKPYIFPYYFMTGRNDYFDIPNQCVSCCFSYMFLHKNCFKYFFDGFIHDPYIYYGEDVLFGLYLLARGVQSYTIPNFVEGVRGATKDKLYNANLCNSSVFYQYHYIFSRPEILNAMQKNNILKLDMGYFEYWRRYLNGIKGGW